MLVDIIKNSSKYHLLGVIYTSNCLYCMNVCYRVIKKPVFLKKLKEKKHRVG